MVSENTGKLIRLGGVRELTALSRTSIYGYMAAGKFPAAVGIGPRAIAWVEDEVREWVAARIAGHRKSGPTGGAVNHAL